MTLSKTENVERFERRIRRIIADNIQQGNDDAVIKSLSSLSYFLYKWNQKYYDEELERIVLDLSKSIVSPGFAKSEADYKTVLFYDSFGMDNRGLVINYLVSLGKIGYSIVYVSPNSSKNCQPVLQNAIKGFDIKYHYVDYDNSMNKVKEIDKIIKNYQPANVFIYPHPLDVSAVVAFTGYKDVLTRFLVNLTDHAFWIGLKSFDFTLEFRNKGGWISRECRGIGNNSTLLLPMFPYVDKSILFEGIAPLFEGKKFIFSGGAIYKTLGDENKRYYKMVRRLLDDNPETLFLYAGSGVDLSEMDKLLSDYPQRAFLIKERKDFFHLMSRCTIYLNTYPLFGGLMTQYAVVAGKLPITLCDRDRGLNGVISNRERLKVEFNEIDDLAKEVHHLLCNDEYREEREGALKGAVVTEEAFIVGLRGAVESHHTGFEFVDEDLGDLNRFRETYRTNFDFNEEKLIAIGHNKYLLKYFPLLFFPLLKRRIFFTANKVLHK